MTHVFVDPEVEPGTWQPQLSVLSIDIETDVRTQTVRAVALSLQDPFRDAPAEEEVLFLGPELHEPGVKCFDGEKMLLGAFRDRLAALDPDVITGWNVIDFDLQVLSDRFRRHRLPFTLGRSREAAVYLPQSEGRGSRVIVPGRQVWDGVRIVRASPDTFEDYSLETVAGALQTLRDATVNNRQEHGLAEAASFFCNLLAGFLQERVKRLRFHARLTH